MPLPKKEPISDQEADNFTVWCEQCGELPATVRLDEGVFCSECFLDQNKEGG